MKNNFKKIALLCTALAMGVGLLTCAINQDSKRKRDDSYKVTKYHQSFDIRKKEKHPAFAIKPLTKKELKEKIYSKKKKRHEHKHALAKLKRHGKGSTIEAKKHEAIIQFLENKIAELKRKLERL